MKKYLRNLFGGLLGLYIPVSWALEPINLDQAVEMALQFDPRIKEQQQLVGVARGMLDEAEAAYSWRAEVNSFVGVTTGVDGGFYEDGAERCPAGSDCVPRSDLYDVTSLSPWVNAEISLIRPLYTFGKVENYADAARGNIVVKEAEVELTQARTRLDVSRAYFGFLAARDSRKLMEDAIGRLEQALSLVEEWLEEGEGKATLSDMFALKSGLALLNRYQAQAQALENVALDALKLLTGIGLEGEIEVADSQIRPLPPPEDELRALQQQALEQRPEMKQVEAGLKARRALVEAKKAESLPNVYAGFGAGMAYSPGRDRLDSPHIFDPFNYVAATPVIGLQWSWAGQTQAARVTQAQAELDALVEKASLARLGIPLQVSEEFRQVHAYSKAVEEMTDASINARRWMIAAYADFEAGIKEADKVLTAFQAYVLAHGDYIRTVNDYNIHVVRLSLAIGVLK